MEIEEAFTTEAIAAAGTNVTDEEEPRLVEMIRHVYSVNEVSHNDQLVELAVLMFVAGRTHQADRITIPVQMSLELANQFMEFLAAKE